MDFGSSPRLAPTSAAPLVPRADVIAEKDSAPVELSPEKTVRSASAGDAVRVDVGADQHRDAARQREQQQQEALAKQAADDATDDVRRRIRIEPQTGSVVLEKTDPETGETLQLLPDETTLKLRILSRQIAERAREAEVAEHLIERTA